jgi:hypothetical protein
VKAAVVLAVILTSWAGCGWRGSRARIRVDVTAASDGPVFSFSFCDGRADQPTLKLLEVVKRLPNGWIREECSLLRRPTNQMVPRSWRMGAPVVGFHIERCDALEPGEHNVAVRGNGQFGWTTFRTDGDLVEVIETACD